ncbi:MAG: cytidylate kinase-like family protein [Ruminiclostridium sp.]|nr:cytidylate kinase-like family protein [Ruminiclostridium sp.]
MKQLIISIGRESGSGGHEIAEKLAQRFDLPLYDKNLLTEIARDKNLDEEALRKYEEAPRNHFFGRSIRGRNHDMLNNSMQAGVFAIQTSWLQEKAEAGDSFIVVGRCAEAALGNHPGLVSLFICGEPDARINRLMKRHNFTFREASDYMVKQDKRRRAYHDENCTGSWGDAPNYHLTISSTPMGIDRTVDFLETYIRERMKDL